MFLINVSPICQTLKHIYPLFIVRCVFLQIIGDVLLTVVTPPGGGKNTHENNAEKASCEEAGNKTYHIVIPFVSRSLADDLAAGFPHSCAGDQREQIFSF